MVRPKMSKDVDLDVKHQHKQTKQMDVNQSIRWSDVTNEPWHVISNNVTFWQV